MATRKKKPVTVMTTAPGALLVIQPPTQEQIAQALTDARAAVSQLESEAQALVITDQATYSQADSLLNRVMNGEKVTEEKFRPIITPLREPLDWIYETRREVDRPLGEVKKVIKEKMGGWQIKEKQRLDAKHQENLRKAKEIADQLNQGMGVFTPMESLFPPQPTNLGAAPGTPAFPTPVQVTYLAPPSTPAPQATHSSTRFEKRVRTTDLDLLVDACMAGEAPVDLLTIRPSVLQGYLESDPVRVASWPGVEVFDHPIITGRS